MPYKIDKMVKNIGYNQWGRVNIDIFSYVFIFLIVFLYKNIKILL